MRIVLGIVGVLLAAILGLCLYAAARPDHFHFQRSLRIAAPPALLFDQIDDLHAFNRWNPYAAKDPKMKLDYRGPARGAGAAYDFAGNGDVGAGSIEIQDSTAGSKVQMGLRMSAPMAARNTIVFTLAPQGETTEVTWAMDGDSPFVAKLMGVVIDMDGMVGRDFETGLASLKALAERR